MNTENIVWAFFSDSHYQQKINDALVLGNPIPKDVYYKDVINNKWIRVTAVFDCIEAARRSYRFNDAKYLGPVDKNTKGTVDQGNEFPSPETKDVSGETSVISTKKKNLKKFNDSEMIYFDRMLRATDYPDDFS